MAELDALLRATDIATPAATTAGQTLPEGMPVDDRLPQLRWSKRFGEWLACQNAGEPLRAWSLFSDGYLYRLLSRQGDLTPAGYDALATPEPGGRRVADASDYPRPTPAGRWAIWCDGDNHVPSVPMPKTFFFYFIEKGDRLLIDGILGEISFSLP